jgi:ligand-binding SRPBCC domain-containing protein
MGRIHLETLIAAPPEVCFDTARDIDVHMAANVRSGERAVAGVTSGKIGMGETVTWAAKHFGVRFHLTSRITAFDPPRSFVDDQVSGPFKRWHHQHHLEPRGTSTLLIDEVSFSSPFGPIGWLVDRIYLESYMTRTLRHHADHIRQAAEERAKSAG